MHTFHFCCCFLFLRVVRFTVLNGISHERISDKDHKCDEFCLVLRTLQPFLQPAAACFYTLHISSHFLTENMRFPDVEKSVHTSVDRIRVSYYVKVALNQIVN